MCVNMEERAGHTGSEKWVTELVCCYLCYEIYCFNAVDRAVQCLNNWGQDVCKYGSIIKFQQ